jgi:hypothetical protein
VTRSTLVTGALALALCAMPQARAASDAELAQIREEIRVLRQSYEARIEALEKRLQEAEARAPLSAPVAAAPAPVSAATPAPVPAPVSAAANAFNPAISLVLQGNYANLKLDPEKYAIHGFAPGGEIGPGKRGFSLAESEIGLAASVDDKFAGNLIVSLTPENTVAVEEAYGILTAAPAGLVPKFGRFFSGIGYLNEQHPHAFDFHGAPLAYEALLGGKYVQDGLQAKWIAPTEHFLEFGAEVGSSEGFPGTARNKNGAASGAIFAHTGGDVGDSHSWRAGVSLLRTHANDRQWSQADLMGNEALLSFSGRSDVAIADFVWKWAPGGNARERSFKLQGEYLRRKERGDLTYDADGALGLTQKSAYGSTQSGWYLQGVYQFMPAWRLGLRYDQLAKGTIDYGSNAANLGLADFTPRRTALMLDWTPSEFSRVRAQFAKSETVPGLTDNQFFLQYILTLGAHGAHRY